MNSNIEFVLVPDDENLVTFYDLVDLHNLHGQEGNCHLWSRSWTPRRGAHYEFLFGNAEEVEIDALIKEEDNTVHISELVVKATDEFIKTTPSPSPKITINKPVGHISVGTPEIKAGAIKV
jgi:hypothetical protein